MKRRLLLCCGVLAAALVAAPPALADPPVITVSPPAPIKTGAPLSFSAAPENSGYRWDLDGDGVFDKYGSSVTGGYLLPGPVTVTVQAEGGEVGKLAFTVVGPNASFQSFPETPIAGQPVQFIFTATEPVAAIDWDLNGDGTFDDAKGAVATTTFAQPGTYAVSLRVTGIEEPPPPARSTATQLVKVIAPPGPVRPSRARARIMSPFPVVRIAGKISGKGALIKRLTVRAPYGSTVRIRCRGGGCPFRRSSRTLVLAGKAKTPSKTIRIKRLEHRLLRGGSAIKVFVTRQGEIGKYTRFLIRKGKAPRRTDLCVAPGATSPSECPTS